jgi:hypothetical protein
MHRLIALFLTVSSSSFSLIAQTSSTEKNKLKVSFGIPFELPSKYTHMGFYGNAEAGYIQVAVKPGKELYVQKFNGSGSYEADAIQDLTKYQKGFKNEGIVEMAGNKFFWTFSYSDKTLSKEMLMYQVLDFGNGQILDQEFPLAEVDGKIAPSVPATPTPQTGEASIYSTSISSDKTKFLVSYKILPIEKSESKNFDVIKNSVFDVNLKKIWETETTLPYSDQEMENENLTVDNKGNVYLTAKVFPNGKSDNKTDFVYEILHLKQDGTVNKITLPSEGRFIKSVFTISNQGEHVYAGGIFSNKTGGSNHGVYLMMINPDSAVAYPVNKGFYELPLRMVFDSESRKQMLDPDKPSDKDQEGPCIVLRSMQVGKDSSVVFAGEQYWTQIYPDNKTTPESYHFNDIYAIRISGDGNILWTKKIPKLQKAEKAKDNMSFKYYNIDDEDYFFFMDNQKNLNLKQDQNPMLHDDETGGYFSYVRVDKEGNTFKSQLFDTKTKKLTFYPSDINQHTSLSIGGRVLAENRYQVMIISK